jgi:hypothetical protein
MARTRSEKAPMPIQVGGRARTTKRSEGVSLPDTNPKDRGESPSNSAGWEPDPDQPRESTHIFSGFQ